MPRYAIMSIAFDLMEKRCPTFDGFYQRIGCNSGNLLFSVAVWEKLAGEKTRVNFVFDPDKLNAEYDALIMPAANWVSPRVDFTDLANRVEKLKIPVIIVGLGAQNENYKDKFTIPSGTERFLKAISERCQAMSLRGPYTQDVLNELGISNTIVTGCPSLYHEFRPFERPVKKEINLEKILLHSTRYEATYMPFIEGSSANLKLFQLAHSKKIDLLYQSEPEEIAEFQKYIRLSEQSKAKQIYLCKTYATMSLKSIENFIEEHGKFFVNLDQWSGAMIDYDFVIGTRLHGTIMALNSGTPGMLLYHDSRTRELAEFSAIPSMDAEKTDLSMNGLKEAYENADFDAYYEKRDENYAIYTEFLKTNSVDFVK